MRNKYVVPREILIYSFRYALGRKSVAPSNVVDVIKSNIEQISNADIELYIREIEQCNYYGMEFDKKYWMEFKSYLKNILDKRN